MSIKASLGAHSCARAQWTLTLSETKTNKLYRDTNEINLHPATNTRIIKITNTTPEMNHQLKV